MADKILLEAFDKLKAIEESDDPFCIGATGDEPVNEYTEYANEAEEVTESPIADIDDILDNAHMEIAQAVGSSTGALNVIRNWLESRDRAVAQSNNRVYGSNKRPNS